MDTVFVKIQFDGENLVMNSNLQKELKPVLESELDIPFELVSVPPPPNTMGVDLVIAIQALSVMVSTLALIWAIIVTRYRCSLSMELHFEDGTKVVIQKEALTGRRLRKEMEILQKEIEEKNIQKKIKEIIYRPKN